VIESGGLKRKRLKKTGTVSMVWQLKYRYIYIYIYIYNVIIAI
jgi:hypothetical protein